MTAGPEDNGHGFTDGFDDSEGLEDTDLVTIHDGERERVCVVLAIAEMDGRQFALLAPRDQLQDVPEDEDEAELELFIFAYSVGDDGIEVYEGIEDEALFDKVRDFFATLIDTEADDDEDVN